MLLQEDLYSDSWKGEAEQIRIWKIKDGTQCREMYFNSYYVLQGVPYHLSSSLNLKQQEI